MEPEEDRWGGRCPECGGELPGAPDLAATLVETGCVYCGAALTADVIPAERPEPPDRTS